MSESKSKVLGYQQKAKDLIAKTMKIQETFEAGRPNSSAESTLEGSLAALDAIFAEMDKRSMPIMPVS